ncbi:MAG: glycosyltransferase family 4 protein [Bifidobacteriaceae bacterium]|jgi:glycosyltransferase involved in cell wall biosynthesis|nr:glycosyltransferase family 4 protein [Bifidobacteriaceae bacterium]
MRLRGRLRRGWRALQRSIGPRFPALVYRSIRVRPYSDEPSHRVVEPAGRGQRLAALGAGAPRRLAVVGGDDWRAALGRAFPLVDLPERADLLIVEPSGMTPAGVAATCDPNRAGGPARFLWLIGDESESAPFYEVAERFDFVFAAELEAALALARRLGPGRVGVAPLPGRDAGCARQREPEDGIGQGGSSETQLDPDLLGQLIAGGRAAAAYSRAAWNFLGLVPAPGRPVEADPETVAAAHSAPARLAQMIAWATGEPPPGPAWAEVQRQLTQAAAGQETAWDAGLEVRPDGWPEGHHRADGGWLVAERRGGGLDWQVKPGLATNFSLVLPGSLGLDRVSADGKHLYVELKGVGPLDGQVAVTLTDAAGNVVTSSWLDWNQRHRVDIPPGAARARLAVRALGEGRAHFTSLRLSKRDRASALPLRSSPWRVAVISADYPSHDNIYSFGFVHTRVLGYRRAGHEVDVIVPGAGGHKRWREHEGVQVLECSTALLRDMLKAGRYDAVAVHFLKPHLWETLAEFADRLPLVVWIHGSDIQPWWRHRHLIHSPEKQAWYEAHTERIMKTWAQVLNAPGSLMRFVFVSRTFAGEVADDLAELGLTFPRERAHVISNGVDTDLFAYQPKPVEQRKRILMVRTFGTRKYGTDLAARAIAELAEDPAFGELEFLIVGDGPLWEEDMGPLRRFPNVRFERRFMTHGQIASLQRDFGVMLQPTRWDSQGVSRDEAMASGMVVISNAVAAVPEFLSEAEGYLAGPEDWHGLAQAVLDLYHHPEVFAAKSAAAAARARADVAASQTVSQEIALLESAKGDAVVG